MSVASWASYPAAGERLLSFIGIEVHWAILQYVLGLPFMAFIALLIYARTRNENWKKIAYTLTKGFVIVFAVGAATGTASEFGLVLLWPNLTEAAGRYIYFPLYMEIFAFLMEIAFIYMLWVGWNRFGPRALAAVAALAFIGAWYSASMIISVNSYMVAPTGIMPAYDPKGVYLYSQGYPKIAVYMPTDIVALLDVPKLQSAGVEVLGTGDGWVKVALPVSVVQQLVRESWSGVALKDSILVGFVNAEAVGKLTMSQVEGLAAKLGLPAAMLAGAQNPVEALLAVPVKNILDYVLMNTVEQIGYTTITFKSPVYIASIIHTIGSALVVSGFTVLAGYALRLLFMPEKAGSEYRSYVETGFRFAAVFTLVAIVFQGFISGHEMGVAIAHWNPEKFAAMEGTSKNIFSLSHILQADKIMPLIAYGSPDAKLPDYDLIPKDYCKLALTGTPPVEDCRPPIILHYIYYTKIGLALALGVYAAIIALVALRSRWSLAEKILGVLRITSPYPSTLLKLAIVAAVAAQAVSTLGWVVREVGRKPWTIYGVMTVDVALTSNPAPAWQLALVSLYFIGLLAALAYTVYRILWLPGRPSVEEVAV